MKTIKLPDEMYDELVLIVRVAVGNCKDWLECCERNVGLAKCISDAKNDLTKTKNLLNKLYEAEE